MAKIRVIGRSIDLIEGLLALDQLSLAPVRWAEQIRLRLHPLLQNILQDLQAVLLEHVPVRVQLLLPLEALLEHVLLKDARPPHPVREDHHPDPMLDALVPHSFVHALICPLHDAVAVALVLRVVALVAVA